MTEKTRSYQVQVDYDSEYQEYVLPLPDGMLEELGWEIGDELLWIDNKDGTFSIKKVDIDQEEAYNNDNEDSN